MIHRIDVEQEIPSPLEETWQFFSTPLNLKRITPPHLGFDVVTNPGTAIYEGLLIEYTVRPFLGIPMRWLSEITHVREGSYFCDEQRSGPYALWHHEHFFESRGGKTMMRDLVTYSLPFGTAGLIALPLVKRSLREIFEFRRQAVIQIFG